MVIITNSEEVRKGENLNTSEGKDARRKSVNERLPV